MPDTNILIPVITAFAAALFTLATGFGLGTMLTPIFLLLYDVKTAILIVAVVHLANNLLKLSLFGRHVDRDILRRFGVMSLTGAFLGAFLQGSMDSSIVKRLLGGVLLLLGLKEIVRFGERLRLPKRIDFIGGFLSGLLGGFVGNQGAVRSAYLLNYSVPKETFIATAALIASIIDLTRIPVYLIMNRGTLAENGGIVFITTVAAFAGTFVGKRLFKNVSLRAFRFYVAAAIAVLGVLLAIGIL